MPTELVQALEYGQSDVNRTRLRNFINRVLFLNAILLGSYWMAQKLQFAQADTDNAAGVVKARCTLGFGGTWIVALVSTVIVHTTARRRLSAFAYVWLALATMCVIRESYRVLRFVYPS